MPIKTNMFWDSYDKALEDTEHPSCLKCFNLAVDRTGTFASCRSYPSIKWGITNAPRSLLKEAFRHAKFCSSYDDDPGVDREV